MKFVKPSLHLLIIAAFAVSAVSCEKPDESANPAESGESSAEGAVAVTQERIDDFGFASRLPADTEAAFGLRHLGDIADAFAGSNFFKRVLSVADSVGERPPADIIEKVRSTIGQYAGNDVFLSFGAGAGEELKTLMEAYKVYNRSSMKMMIEQLVGGQFGAAAQPVGLGAVLAAEDGKFLELMEKAQLPPILAGTRVTGGADEVLAKLVEFEGQLPPAVVVSDVEIDGLGTFKLWSVAVKDVLGPNERAKVREMITDPAMADRVIEILDAKKAEFAYGMVGDMLLVSLGPDHSHIKLASKPEESLLSKDVFAFADGFAGKKLFAYEYINQSMLDAYQSMGEGQWSDITDALQAGAAKMAENGMDLTKVSALIGKLGDQLDAMSQRKAEPLLSLGFLDDGLKFEAIGGFTFPSMDADAKLVFAPAIPSDAFLAIDGATTPEAEERSMEMLETLGQLAYEAGKAFMEMQGDPDQLAQFNQFDELFRPKLLALWDVLRNKFQAGLGTESALVVDLKGSLPKIPGIPNVITENGLMPRMVIANTVTDRKLVAESWDAMVPIINDIAKSVPGQEQGAEFQLPDPVTSEKNGLKTHFISLPFMSNDFLPSISINDKVFLLSTSKNLSEDIAANVEPGDMTGLIYRVNIDALRAFGSEWLRLLMQHTDEIFAEQYAADTFRENAGMIQTVLDLMQVINGIEGRVFVEDGHTRQSLHLKLSDVPPSLD